MKVEKTRRKIEISFLELGRTALFRSEQLGKVNGKFLEKQKKFPSAVQILFPVFFSAIPTPAQQKPPQTPSQVAREHKSQMRGKRIISMTA
jgi:hypothetical protein